MRRKRGRLREKKNDKQNDQQLNHAPKDVFKAVITLPRDIDRQLVVIKHESRSALKSAEASHFCARI